MKKLFSLVLALALVLSLASCAGKVGPAKVKTELPEGKKVAIIVAPETQYPEEYKAAKQLEKDYPSNVTVIEYPDSRVLKAGDPEIWKAAEKAASDKSVAAIIFDRATQFTPGAVRAAKKINPDIITVAVEPERDYEQTAKEVNLIYQADWLKYADEIFENAAGSGAANFVFFSIADHAGNNPMYKRAMTRLNDKCSSGNIKFIYRQVTDPIYSGGISAAEQSVQDELEKLFESGEISDGGTVVFSTDSTVQKKLVELTEEKGLIYIAPPFPCAFSGAGEYFGTELPGSMKDLPSYIRSLKSAVSQANGKYFVYNYTLASVMLNAVVLTVFDYLVSGEKMDTSVMTVRIVATEKLVRAADNDSFTAVPSEIFEKAIECYAPALEALN